MSTIIDQTFTTMAKRAYRIAGVLGPQDGDPDAAMLADALLIVNGMLDSWSIDGLTVYFHVISDPLPLVSPQRDYTIGESGAADFDVQRPASIISANIIVDGNPDVRYPLQLIDEKFYMSLPVLQIGPMIPQYLYYQPGYPDATIRLYGYPSSGYFLELQYWQNLTQFEAVDDDFVFPPGYWEAMVYSLAERLASEWGAQDAAAEISVVARSARERIKNLNSTPIPMQMNEAALLTSRRPDNYTGPKSQILGTTLWYN